MKSSLNRSLKVPTERRESRILKELERKLLSELIKNSHRSDRELAKAIGSSQPTTTRLRNKLEKEGYIREYTIIPKNAGEGGIAKFWAMDSGETGPDKEDFLFIMLFGGDLDGYVNYGVPEGGNIKVK